MKLDLNPCGNFCVPGCFIVSLFQRLLMPAQIYSHITLCKQLVAWTVLLFGTSSAFTRQWVMVYEHGYRHCGDTNNKQ